MAPRSAPGGRSAIKWCQAVDYQSRCEWRMGVRPRCPVEPSAATRETGWADRAGFTRSGLVNRDAFTGRHDELSRCLGSPSWRAIPRGM
ncbi:MAG: hypothetical protein QOE61_269 [Micromonosporaceae bacterium]|jgi:hypothetical protein|nr:hypothetical protein [Micromonosporaceae bacterium]